MGDFCADSCMLGMFGADSSAAAGDLCQCVSYGVGLADHALFVSVVAFFPLFSLSSDSVGTEGSWRLAHPKTSRDMFSTITLLT